MISSGDSEPVEVHTSPPSDADSTNARDERAVLVRRIGWGLVVLGVLLTAGFLLWVSTESGHRLDAAAYFDAKDEGALLVAFDRAILDHITRISLGVVLILILVGAGIRRYFPIGGVAVLGVVVAVAGAEVLKRVLPWSELIPADASYGRGLREGSYPSGHATIATSVALALVILAPVTWRQWVAPGALLLSAGVATGVVVGGWHRPSDAFGGVCWAGLVMGASVLFSLRLRPDAVKAGRVRQSRAPLLGLVTVGLVVFIGLWLASLPVRKGMPDTDLAFMTTMGVIVVAAFCVIWWMATALRTVEWAPTRSPARP